MKKLTKEQIISLWQKENPDDVKTPNEICQECYKSYLESPNKLFAIHVNLAGRLHLYSYDFENVDLVSFCLESYDGGSGLVILCDSVDIMELIYRISFLIKFVNSNDPEINYTVKRIKDIMVKWGCYGGGAGF